jgi:hypothetical protein
MTLDALNKWLTLLANFGVIGGLVLVALQMNFNTETIRLQNDLELNREFAAGELAYMGDSTPIAYANALFHPADLTEPQLGQFWAYLHNVMLAAQNNWLAYRDGQASETSWNHARKQAAGFIGFRAARIWWAHDKFEYEDDFVAQIDAELAGSDPLDVERVTRQMLEEIRSLGRTESPTEPKS